MSDTGAQETAPRRDTAPADAPVLVERPEAGIAVIVLNRPKARNALSLAMMDAVSAAITEVSEDPSIHVAILAATGPAYCAGHDLKEMTAARKDTDKGRSFFTGTMQRCAHLMQQIVSCQKPIIAAVHATATAAGCQLVATCDLGVASESARFCTPGVNIGLFCSTPMVALTRNVSRKRAMEMLLLGEMLSAADAKEYGLINRVTPQENVREEALAMARLIAAKSPATVAIGKRAFYEQIDMPLAEAYTYATSVMIENMLEADAAEGIDAFLGKRAPNWKGL